MPAPRELLTKADVADIVGIGPSAITLAARLGKLKVFAITPRGVRLFERRDVAKYAASRKS